MATFLARAVGLYFPTSTVDVELESAAGLRAGRIIAGGFSRLTRMVEWVAFGGPRKARIRE
jgi:hypothetical protein